MTGRVGLWTGERMWNSQKDCHVQAMTLAPRHETHPHVTLTKTQTEIHRLSERFPGWHQNRTLQRAKSSFNKLATTGSGRCIVSIPCLHHGVRNYALHKGARTVCINASQSRNSLRDSGRPSRLARLPTRLGSVSPPLPSDPYFDPLRLTASPPHRPIRSRQQTLKQPRCRRLIPQLNHVYYPRSPPFIADLHCHPRLGNPFHSVGKDDRRDEHRLGAAIALHDELLDVARLLGVQLEFARTEGFPLRVTLLEEDFALHLRGNNRGTSERRGFLLCRRGWRRGVVVRSGLVRERGEPRGGWLCCQTTRTRWRQRINGPEWLGRARSRRSHAVQRGV